MATDQVQNSIASLIEKLNKNLNRIQWVKCPSCSDEWTQLRKCDYLDDSDRPAQSYLCVICSETLVAWDWLIAQMPMRWDGISSSLRWTAPRLSRTRWGGKEGRIETMDRPQNAYVVVEIGGQEIIARSRGTGHPIRFKVKGSDEEHTADNIYALRSKILNTVPF